MQMERSATGVHENETVAIRRHLQIHLVGQARPSARTPIGGNREIHLLARKEPRLIETPVFPASPKQRGDEAVVAFTSRELGTLYLQVAHWDEYETRDVAAIELGDVVRQIRDQGVGYIMVNPNRHDQALGVKSQSLFPLEGLRDLSGENLFGELLDRGR